MKIYKNAQDSHLDPHFSTYLHRRIFPYNFSCIVYLGETAVKDEKS